MSKSAPYMQDMFSAGDICSNIRRSYNTQYLNQGVTILKSNYGYSAAVLSNGLPSELHKLLTLTIKV